MLWMATVPVSSFLVNPFPGWRVKTNADLKKYQTRSQTHSLGLLPSAKYQPNNGMKKWWQLYDSFSPVTNVALEASQVLSEDIVHQITKLVEERGDARWNGNYEKADQLKGQILDIQLPEGLELHLEDLSRSQGGGSTWKVVLSCPKEEASTSRSLGDKSSPSVLQLAHAALGLAVSCSKTTTPEGIKQEKLLELVNQAKESLLEWKQVQEKFSANCQQRISSISSSKGWITVETQLRGRKPADAAFWFALVGVVDDELFDLLAMVCTKELHRFGSKPSCRAKDILQMMDRLAAAGIRSDNHPELGTVARACLLQKQTETENVELNDNGKLLNLHSDRCLLMLWKFSARQKKQQSFLQSARKHWEKQQSSSVHSNENTTNASDESWTRGTAQDIVWEDLFEDPTLPLVVDVGCGMGISLLGLASLEEYDEANLSRDTLGPTLFNDCNFVGVDLSGLAVGYAKGIAKRWRLNHRLQFVVDSAETFLEEVKRTYRGNVSLCMIQFPTPYRLSPNESSSHGNSQLPKSALDGFMTSPSLLRLAKDVLTTDEEEKGGSLLLQSNCEDVAIWMQRTACLEGFEALAMPNQANLDHVNGRTGTTLPQRTLNWISIGGERAIGNKWSASPFLPRKGTTETETACQLNETPIHRCLLVPTKMH